MTGSDDGRPRPSPFFSPDPGEAQGEDAAEPGPVEAATRRDISDLPKRLQESGMAATALTLARRLDEAGLRDSPPLARELRTVLVALQAQAPKKSEGDDLDELARRRAERRAASSD